MSYGARQHLRILGTIAAHRIHGLGLNGSAACFVFLPAFRQSSAPDMPRTRCTLLLAFKSRDYSALSRQSSMAKREFRSLNHRKIKHFKSFIAAYFSALGSKPLPIALFLPCARCRSFYQQISKTWSSAILVAVQD